jgi:enamine deaminase RidA (YjgF/YER057c/UK114 family)
MNTRINAEELELPVAFFSHAIAVDGPGRLLFVSGLTSRGPDAAIVGTGDIGLQAETILGNLAKVLAAAGGTLDDIVKLTIYVRDMTHAERILEVEQRFFSGPPPASTMVEVSRLFDPEHMLEIEAVAALEN